MAGSTIEAWSHDEGKDGRSVTGLHGSATGKEQTYKWGHGNATSRHKVYQGHDFKVY